MSCISDLARSVGAAGDVSEPVAEAELLLSLKKGTPRVDTCPGTTQGAPHAVVPRNRRPFVYLRFGDVGQVLVPAP